MKHPRDMSTYEKEVLTALYASLDFMQCNDLPCEDVKKAMASIESKYSEDAPKTAIKEDFKPGTTLICKQEGFEFTISGRSYSDDDGMFNARGAGGSKTLFTSEASCYWVK